MKLYKAEGYSGCFANYEQDFQEMNYLKNAYDIVWQPNPNICANLEVVYLCFFMIDLDRYIS